MKTLPSSIRLRSVESTDLPIVAALERECFVDPYPESFLAELSEYYRETFLVALSDERIVGYAVLALGSDSHHLLSIAVTPSHRRLGIAKDMLAFLEAAVPKRTIVLELRKSNTSASDFYRKNGFLETGTVRKYYQDGEDAITMEKSISTEYLKS